jgi:hypothetical protein
LKTGWRVKKKKKLSCLQAIGIKSQALVPEN